MKHLFFLITFELAIAITCNAQSEWQKQRMINKLQETIPATLLNEKSYDPICYEFCPRYITENDVESCIKEIKHWIEYADEYIAEMGRLGLQDSDYLKPYQWNSPYPYGWGNSTYVRGVDLGFFSGDDFLWNQSFYEIENILRNRYLGIGMSRNAKFCSKNSYNISSKFSDFFATKSGGSLYTATVYRTLGDLKRKGKDILYDRLVELSKLKDKLALGKVLIGYDVMHKFNASNQYGGYVTKSNIYHFNLALENYWYEDTSVNGTGRKIIISQ